MALTDYQTIVNLIASTKTGSGLTVKARLDKKKYKRGIKVSKDEMKQLRMALLHIKNIDLRGNKEISGQKQWFSNCGTVHVISIRYPFKHQNLQERRSP